MAEGIFESMSNLGSNLGFDIWVAIRFVAVTSFIEKIEQSFRNALGSPLTIFAHPDERRPINRPQERKEDQWAYAHLATRRNEAIEIGEPIVEPIAHALDAIKRNAAHCGQASDRGSFHINEGGVVRGSEAAFFGIRGHLGTGGKPEIACARVTAESLAGAHVDDSRQVVSGARHNISAERSGPADGKHQAD